MGRGGFHIPEGNSQAPGDAQEFFCMTSRDRFSGEFPDPGERERGPDRTARSGPGGARPCPPRRLPPPVAPLAAQPSLARRLQTGFSGSASLPGTRWGIR